MESRSDIRPIGDRSGERVGVSMKPPRENHAQNQGFQGHESVSASKTDNGLEPLGVPLSNGRQNCRSLIHRTVPHVGLSREACAWMHQR